MGDFNEWTRGLASKVMGSAFEVAEPRAFCAIRAPILACFPCFIWITSIMTSNSL